MSPKQTALYWKTWSALCAEFVWQHNSAPRRHALNESAGCPASIKNWGNKEFDRFLDYARALLAGEKTGGEKIVDEKGERRRLVWRIKKDITSAGWDEAYVAKVATHMYGLGCWDQLSLDQLKNLRDTIRNRTRKKAPKQPKTAVAKEVIADPCMVPKAKEVQTADCPF